VGAAVARGFGRGAPSTWVDRIAGAPDAVPETVLIFDDDPGGGGAVARRRGRPMTRTP